MNENTATSHAVWPCVEDAFFFRRCLRSNMGLSLNNPPVPAWLVRAETDRCAFRLRDALLGVITET